MRIKAKLPEDDFRELVRPKLKLFLSVDIVGSTVFKQRDNSAHSQTWLNLFVSFFSEFPELLSSAVTEQEERDNLGKLPPLKLWKSLGDEVIFTVELKQRGHAAFYLKAFASALQQAAKNWRTDPARRELHVKGTGWLAGFPVGNVEIPLQIAVDENSDGRDYIGPLIDTGFRLKEFATSRKLVLSADLAYLLLSAGVGGLQFFFEGESTLKGVLRGRPYPLIWLDSEGHLEIDPQHPVVEMHRLKDKLTNRHHADPETLKKYLSQWLKGASIFMCIPFINGDPFGDLKPADDYMEKLQRAKDDLQNLFYVQQSEQAGKGRTATHVSKETEELLQNLPSSKVRAHAQSRLSREAPPTRPSKKSLPKKKTARQS